MDGPRTERQKKESLQSRAEELIVRGIPDHLVPKVAGFYETNIPGARGFLYLLVEPLKACSSLGCSDVAKRCSLLCIKSHQFLP